MHFTDPDIGLKTARGFLEECYSSPKVIESALFERIEYFSKINTKDRLKLRELGELLMESTKSEGYLLRLLYLEHAKGVNPIVE